MYFEFVASNIFLSRIIFVICFINGILGGKVWAVNKINSIRFYERQYFKGNYWTLKENGSWTSSRKTQIKVPYRFFHPRSIRTFCSSQCHWKICPMRRFRNSKLKRRTGCNFIKENDQIESLRPWGWANRPLGYATILARRRKKIKKKRKKNNDTIVNMSTFLPPLNITETKHDDSFTDFTTVANDSEIQMPMYTTTNSTLEITENKEARFLPINSFMGDKNTSTVLNSDNEYENSLEKPTDVDNRALYSIDCNTTFVKHVQLNSLDDRRRSFTTIEKNILADIPPETLSLTINVFENPDLDDQAHDKYIIKSNKVIDSYATKEPGSQNRAALGISDNLESNDIKTNISFPSTYDAHDIPSTISLPMMKIQDKRKEISSQEEKINESINSIRHSSNASTLPSLKLSSTTIGPFLIKNTENKSQAEVYNNFDVILPVETLINDTNISNDENSNTKTFSSGLIVNHNTLYEETNMNTMRRRVIKSNITDSKSRNISSLLSYSQSNYNFSQMKDVHIYEETPTSDSLTNQDSSENDASASSNTMSNYLFSFGTSNKTKGIKNIEDFEVTSLPTSLQEKVLLPNNMIASSAMDFASSKDKKQIDEIEQSKRPSVHHKEKSVILHSTYPTLSNHSRMVNKEQNTTVSFKAHCFWDYVVCQRISENKQANETFCKKRFGLCSNRNIPKKKSSARLLYQIPIKSRNSVTKKTTTSSLWLSKTRPRQRAQTNHVTVTSNNDFENKNNICLSVTNNPRSYTVSHPSDYSKFYMCQEIPCSNFKGKCWIAHLMHCPINTGFDTNLKACNWISKLSSNHSRAKNVRPANYILRRTKYVSKKKRVRNKHRRSQRG